MAGVVGVAVTSVVGGLFVPVKGHVGVAVGFRLTIATL